MAIWQYNFFIIPNLGTQEFKILNDEFDDSLFWKEVNTNCSFFEKIEVLLKKSSSWHENLTIYGNLESNCLEVLCEGKYIISVTLRIDFTTNYEILVREILNFFILHGLVMLDEQLNIVSLNFEIIKNIITNSNQFNKYISFTSN